MAGLVRGFPNIAVLPDRPPNTALTGERRPFSRAPLVRFNALLARACEDAGSFGEARICVWAEALRR
jgi:hypothetical protein